MKENTSYDMDIIAQYLVIIRYFWLSQQKIFFSLCFNCYLFIYTFNFWFHLLIVCIYNLTIPITDNMQI